MTRDVIREWWRDVDSASEDEEGPRMLGAADGDPLDEAFIGLTQLPPAGMLSWRTVAVYDTRKVVEILMRENGWSEEEALDHFGYNVEGSSSAEHGPVFMLTPETE